MKLEEQYTLLESLKSALADAPDGLSTGDIAQRYSISIEAARKYLSILQIAGVPIYDERQRYFLDLDYFAPFRLTEDESDLLHILLQRSLLYHLPHSHLFRRLIHKLGGKMGMSAADHKELASIVTEQERPFDRWFSVLMHAKRHRLEVEIDYHPLNKPYESRWRVRPQRFVSNPFSDGLYLHGQGTLDGEAYIPLSLRFDRILKVELTEQKFSIIDIVESASYAGRTWSVWNSGDAPVTVELHFELRHYDRLLETIWHPTQHIRVVDDQTVVFTVSVSAPQEMIPWIRSWGSGVVVVAPAELRQHIVHTLRRQMQAYGLDLSQDDKGGDPLAFLWAKYNRTTGAAHLLVYHLLDAAAVAVLMWDTVLTQTQREWIAQSLKLEQTEARQMVALLVGLHDIGKATPFFQHRAEIFQETLQTHNLSSESRFERQHGLLSAVILADALEKLGLNKRAVMPVAQAIGGHHGRWITRKERQDNIGSIGRERWQALQTQLITLMQQVMTVPQLALPAGSELNTFTTFLSGFVSVCDWIGSNNTFFPYEMTWLAPDVYWTRALAQARTALAETGWFGWQKPHTVASFDVLFPPYTPNPVQQAIIDRCQAPDGPYKLVLIESLTGGGKTEMALYVADLLVNQFDLAGVYVAMPTQATSNQMFGRVSRFLETRYPQQSINVQLAHSQADHHPLYSRPMTQSPSEGDTDTQTSHLRAEEWFQNRKRSLLAPFAVGTVDQAMMSVLQVNHHFVRQYALAHKVVIFDEIHAYDTYMNEIIARLQNWLAALQAPMIMLSATLPASTRRSLIQNAGGQGDFRDDVPYPRLTLVDHIGQIQVHPLPAPPTRILRLDWFEGDMEALCQELSLVYEQGGCIALINNTVDEAIRITQALHRHGGFDHNDIILFHARFPLAWRSIIEDDVVSRFSKTGERPKRAIVVATQIIEQSLDLDFDLMVTQLAPIDLLIQRAGRLHRHQRPDRPAHVQQPTLVIRQSASNEQGLPDFGVDEAIYARYILLKTWLTLRDKSELSIPDEIDALMACVYDSSIDDISPDVGWQKALQAAYEDLERGDNRKQFRGSQYCIPRPQSDELFSGQGLALTDDEEHNIVTREILPNIVIVCVRGDEADETLPLLPLRRPTHEEIAVLLRSRVTITRQTAVDALKKQPACDHWQRVPALQQARPIPFVQGEYRVPDSSITLRLSDKYGLEIVEDTP